MGAWGTGLFDDDTALDVKGGWRDLLAETGSGTEATRRLLESWGYTRASLAEDPIFCYALAATQWKHGWLEDDIKQLSLALLKAGTDHEGWEQASPADRAERGKALAALREQLLSPQPPPRTVRKRVEPVTPFAVGDVLAMTVPDGRI